MKSICSRLGGVAVKLTSVILFSLILTPRSPLSRKRGGSKHCVKTISKNSPFSFHPLYYQERGPRGELFDTTKNKSLALTAMEFRARFKRLFIENTYCLAVPLCPQPNLPTKSIIQLRTHNACFNLLQLFLRQPHISGFYGLHKLFN